MKNIMLVLLLSALCQAAFGQPYYWGVSGGTDAAIALTPQDCADSGLGFTHCVIKGTLNPSVSAVNAPQGSVYISTTAGIFQKTDSGSSTNWSKLLIAPVNLATQVTGLLPTANGGLNVDASGFANNSLLVRSGASYAALGPLTNGQLVIGSTGAAPVLAAITAVANQTTVSGGAGSITIGTAQNIATGSSPTFAGMTIGALSGVVKATAGVLSAGLVNLASEITGLLPGANMTPMVGATGVANGVQGAVPQPLITNQLQYLRGDGTYATPADTGVTTVGTINSQTKSANGLVISGTSIVAQTADGTAPGQIALGAQTLGTGVKTIPGIIDSTNTTAGRVLYTGTSGRHTTDGGFLYDPAFNLLTVAGNIRSQPLANATGDIVWTDSNGQFSTTSGLAFLSSVLKAPSAAFSSLTATRIPFAGTAGLLEDLSTFTMSKVTGLLSVFNINVTTTTEASKFMGMMAYASAPTAVGKQGYCFYASDVNSMYCSDNVNWNLQGVQPNIESGSFTPTGSWTGGNVTYSGRYWITGAMALYEYKIALTGAPTGGTLTFNTPHTMDVANILGTGNHDAYLNLGCVAADTGTQSYDLDIQYLTTTTVRPQLKGASGTYVRPDQSIIDATTPFTFGNTDTVTCRFMVPVTGRAASFPNYSTRGQGDTFSAQVSATGVVSGEASDWINGNCTNANPSVCTFSSSYFTVAPNCIAGPANTSSTLSLTTPVTSTSSAATIQQNSSLVATQNPFTLICQKQGVDFLAARMITATFKDVLTAPNSPSGLPKQYLLAFTCSGASSFTSETLTGTPTIGNISSGDCVIAIPATNFTDISKVACDMDGGVNQFWQMTYTSTSSLTFSCTQMTSGSSTIGNCSSAAVRATCTQY